MLDDDCTFCVQSLHHLMERPMSDTPTTHRFRAGDSVMIRGGNLGTVETFDGCIATVRLADGTVIPVLNGDLARAPDGEA